MSFIEQHQSIYFMALPGLDEQILSSSNSKDPRPIHRTITMNIFVCLAKLWLKKCLPKIVFVVM